MSAEIVMPRLSDSMEEGTILKWLKSDGESVSRGEPIAEIETDKATLTFESDAAGVLEIVVAAGETLPIGELIARLDDGSGAAAPATGEKPSAAAPPAAQDPEAAGPAPAEAATEAAPRAPSGEVRAAAEPPAAAAEAPQPAAPERKTGRVKASPLARRIAREHGLDLHLVEGTGPGGRVVRADVEEARAAGTAKLARRRPPRAPAGRARRAEALPRVSARRRGARPLAEADRGGDRHRQGRHHDHRAHPHPAGHRPPDGGVEGHRARVHAALGDRHGGLRRAAHAAQGPRRRGAVLQRHDRQGLRARPARVPARERQLQGRQVRAAQPGERRRRGGGNRRPRRADDLRRRPKSLREIARESRALAEKVRAGTVTPPELSGGTFTVSNLGMFGVTDFTAVINPPQAAILAVGALAPRAVVRDAELVARNTMGVTLACDHRILYGADAAQFLARIRELLEQPLALAF